jgi:hypothetical protein
MTNSIDQVSKAAEILKGLKNALSAGDRKAAKNELRLSGTTISEYLRGSIRDLDTATSLIVFFRKAIAKRDRILTKTGE